MKNKGGNRIGGAGGGTGVFFGRANVLLGYNSTNINQINKQLSPAQIRLHCRRGTGMVNGNYIYR